MPQPFLETGKNGLLVACLDIDHAVGRQPGLRDRRCKQIWPRHAPQNLSTCSGCNTGRKQCRCRAIDCTIPTAGHLMQPPKRQPSSRQHPIDRRDAEREYRPFARISAFETRDALSEIGNDSSWRRCTHLSLETRNAWGMFIICSHLGKESIGMM